MSVLLQMAMFPTDKSESKSKEVSEVIKIIKDSGMNYQLTSMATIIETSTMKEALALVEKCYSRLEELGCSRVYTTLNFDIRIGHENRLKTKIESVEKHIGEVSK
ncbi:MTH1187 family thiamine-binding protein [Aliarcobacter butzleri]|uniref:MTH1187 family thiamine-binding protein n=1 Tax=Aliarcobacter butzleri TaxID=28197 RepID=UPI00215AB76A|nr:MTH1187 family thiamine-binding protein [Aliarcobacter butzleri]MCR8710415.1 MTH1187 family thiamine-binding protein [Aliarcobacter butzleri]